MGFDPALFLPIAELKRVRDCFNQKDSPQPPKIGRFVEWERFKRGPRSANMSAFGHRPSQYGAEGFGCLIALRRFSGFLGCFRGLYCLSVPPFPPFPQGVAGLPASEPIVRWLSKSGTLNTHSVYLSCCLSDPSGQVGVNRNAELPGGRPS
jgi:hypothetical protein